MASEPLSRDVAVARLAQAEADIRALGVARLALFGSVARDEARADSDVDLLVQFVPGEKSFGRFMALCDLLESVLHHKVELVTTESLSPFIGPRILAEAHDVVPNCVPELRRQLATILTQQAADDAAWRQLAPRSRERPDAGGEGRRPVWGSAHAGRHHPALRAHHRVFQGAG